jgi:hypothetical protein
LWASLAAEPERAGSEKYDVTAVTMIVLLKYGTGVPLHSCLPAD